MGQGVQVGKAQSNIQPLSFPLGLDPGTQTSSQEFLVPNDVREQVLGWLEAESGWGEGTTAGRVCPEVLMALGQSPIFLFSPS